jgi:hypothetical protein
MEKTATPLNELCMRRWKHARTVHASLMASLEIRMIASSTKFFPRTFVQCKKSRRNKDFLRIKKNLGELFYAPHISPRGGRTIKNRSGRGRLPFQKFFHRLAPPNVFSDAKPLSLARIGVW